MEVQSDFELALRVRDARGRTTTVAHYVGSSDTHVEVSVVPHLQRVSPNGHWLASYDVPAGVVDLSPLPFRRSASRVRLKVDGLGADETIEQFRWSDDGADLLVSTRSQVYRVPGVAATAASAADGAAAPALTAEPLLSARFDGDERRIEDTRTIEGGMIVRLAHGRRAAVPDAPLEIEELPTFGGTSRALTDLIVIGDEDYYDLEFMDDEDRIVWRSDVVYVPLTEEGAGTPVPLLAPGDDAKGAMPLADGTVAVAVGPFTDELWAMDDEGEAIWIARPGASGWDVVERRLCRDGCETVNWAPGTDVPIYATWDDEIVLHGETVTSFDAADYLGDSDVLWSQPGGTDLLIGGWDTLGLVSRTGEERWAMTLEEDAQLSSATFDASGDNVWVGTDSEILRVDAATGESTRVVKIKAYERFDEDEGTEENDWHYVEERRVRKIDSVIPLPGGGVAYSVLTATETSESF